MLFTTNMSYLGVSKAILEGAGPAVENQCALLGMATSSRLEGREYYNRTYGRSKR